MRLPATCAATTVDAVLVDLRSYSRHLEDLMALRLTGQLDLAAAITNRLGFAVNKTVHFGLVEHGATVTLMPGLRAALAITGPALRSVEFAGAIRGRRLGRVGGIQIDALFEHLYAFDQHRDDGVALRHGLRKLRHHRIEWVHQNLTRRLDLHRGSIATKSATCNA